MTKEQFRFFLIKKCLMLDKKEVQVITILKKLEIHPSGKWPDSHLIKAIFIGKDLSLDIILKTDPMWSISFYPLLSEDQFLSIELTD